MDTMNKSCLGYMYVVAVMSYCLLYRDPTIVKKSLFNFVVELIWNIVDNSVVDCILYQVIDKSFGFDTAVEEAQRAINAAHVEAESTENGIGVVKLMGRYSGMYLFISKTADIINVSSCFQNFQNT